MSIEVCVSAKELRKALKRIERAEDNGFNHCLAVFRLSSAGRCLDECLMAYDDLIERAHPTNPHFNWGRGQQVTETCEFRDGKLVEKPK